MDKRFITFFVLMVAILVGHQWLTQKFFPPPPKKPAEVAQNPPAAKPSATAGAAATGTPTATATAAPTGTGPAAQAPRPDAEGAPPAAAAPAAPAAPAKFPARWTTLGSLDDASPYRMLVTFNARGAVVERVELNHPRYHEIDNLHPLGGYLGHLAAEEFTTADGDKRKPVGVRIRVVGPGTPAAAAGLQADDVITAIADRPVFTPEALAAVLRDTDDGDVVKIDYLRGVSDGRPGNAQVAQAKLGRTPLQLIRPEFSDPADPKKADPLSFLTTLQDAGGETLPLEKPELPGVDLHDAPWELVAADPKQPDTVAFRRTLPQRNVEIVKRYTLQRRAADAKHDTADAYTLGLRIDLKNLADKPSLLAYRLGGPTGLPVEGAWYSRDAKISIVSGTGMRDVIYGQYDDGYQSHGVFSCTQIVDGDVTHLTEKPITYVGVDAMYFTAALKPRTESPDQRRFSRVVPLQVGRTPSEAYRKKEADVSFQMMRTPVEVAAGQTLSDEFQVFLGPKVPELMDAYGMGAQIDYGWFDWVAIPMLWLLHTLYGFVGNYGIAIILLTIVVRSAMHPLTRKQAQNAVKMQQLQPEIKKLAEKYKGKREEQARAQQELFRKHNYNPFSGCLPIFIQIPIFVGLYNSLRVDVELRQAPLISENIRWASDLSAPDMLWDWRPFMPTFLAGENGWLGPFFNLLPCITIGLFLLQNKLMMPPPTDEQTAMQQKVMKYMMVFMGFMFFKVPAGLCVYFVTGSIWGICERMLLPKHKPGTPASAAVIDVEVKKPAEPPRRQKKR